VVRLGYHEDQTSAISHWHVPLAHYLESWGDALAADGSYLSIQPMILPLFGGLSEVEIMNALLGRPKVEGPELVQETFRATKPPGDFQTAWSKFLHDGFGAHVALHDRPATFNGGAAAVPRSSFGPPCRRQLRNRPKLCSSGVTRWTMAATATTAGFRNCQIRSRN
jgi:hypothetical protein